MPCPRTHSNWHLQGLKGRPAGLTQQGPSPSILDIEATSDLLPKGHFLIVVGGDGGVGG